ncbi:hypothetical protein VN97_g5979, partial [Penicillium thymicola]
QTQNIENKKKKISNFYFTFFFFLFFFFSSSSRLTIPRGYTQKIIIIIRISFADYGWTPMQANPLPPIGALPNTTYFTVPGRSQLVVLIAYRLVHHWSNNPENGFKQ